MFTMVIFAWWDGILTISDLLFNLASGSADFALARMQDATREVTHLEEPLTPEAQAYAERIDAEREAAHETIRRTVVRLNELDAVYARIHHVGRKKNERH